MSNRIRQLEDALAILQSTISDKRHPLLSDELLKVKFGAEALNPHQDSSSDRNESMLESVDVLGTLTLGDSGEVKYFGRSAGSEVCEQSLGKSISPFRCGQTLMMVMFPFFATP